MASTKGIAISFPGKGFWCHNNRKKNERTMPLKLPATRANSGNSPHQSLEVKVNGKKVNGSPKLKVIERDDPTPQSCLLGRFVEDRLVYRQSFIIRSYEIGPDKTATMETLMNLLQETALNHVASSGIGGDGFGATREMSLRKLIWVVTRIHIQVQSYSSWGDIVEIDTWVDAAGKNGMRRDWIIRDFKTRQIITRATSTWVIMNRETRKLSKMAEQVREELIPFYISRVAMVAEENDLEKIDKLTDETADRIRSGLAPRWSDMDANQHVNNVKYIGWLLESVAINVLEEYHLKSLTLEYRRECRQSNLVESLTSAADSKSDKDSYSVVDHNRKGDLKFTHLIRLQSEEKAEIVRARTEWQSKLKARK